MPNPLSMTWTSFPATTLFILIFATPLHLLHSPYPAASHFLANAQPTGAGNIPLYRDEFGFYTYAYIAPTNSDNSDEATSSPISIPVTVGIYASKTTLMTNCLNFSNFTCSYPTCDPLSNSKGHQDYPYFTAKGYEASAVVYLDNNYWSLYDFALIANSCKSNASESYGSSRYGVLGLGIVGSNAQNYINDVIFSLSVASDLQSAQLNFFPSREIPINRERLTTPMPADQNWYILKDNTSVIQFGNFNSSNDYGFFFDLGAVAMGFPHNLFESIMEYCRQEIFLSCNHAFTLPQCWHNDTIDNLPNMTITLHNNTIVIPPSVYIQNSSNLTGVQDLVTLNFRAIGQHLTGDSYALPDYMNNIVFDINFMSQYYILFNTTDEGAGKISFFKNQDNSSPDDNSDAIYIVFGCVGLVVLLGIVFCVYKCYKSGKGPLKSRRSRISLANSYGALLNNDSQKLSKIYHDNAIRTEQEE